MKIDVKNSCSDFNSYRAARVKSLFNAESGANFSISADLPVDDSEWSLGLIVGPSGSGKTSIGKRFWDEDVIDDFSGWPDDRPVIDAIAPDGDFNDVTASLAAVGLGTVPTWLRPYSVLSNGEKFRANLARIICDAPQRVVIDEFTSVVDRQIAKFGAMAFAKSWKRLARDGGNQCVLLSCHYDIIEWLEPDWVFDTATGKYAGRSLWRRPRFDLEIWETDWRYWYMFEPHHYLKLPKMIAARCYVGAVDGEPVCHVAVSPAFQNNGFRAARLVVMPEWQGAGVGIRFLNAVCAGNLDGKNKWNKKLPTFFHTSHPGLCAALRRDKSWIQCSSSLFGVDKAKSRKRIMKSIGGSGVGYGGHFRAVQGFKYIGVSA